MAKFVVFGKRHEPNESQLRVFCMTDDKEDKTLENQEHFAEIAKSRDVEVLENKAQFLEFAGNLQPVTKSGEQLYLVFNAFKENRLPFTIRVKDANQEPVGRIAFMRDNRRLKSDHPQQPICNLNVKLPEITPYEPPKRMAAMNGHYNGHDSAASAPAGGQTTRTVKTTTTTHSQSVPSSKRNEFMSNGYSLPQTKHDNHLIDDRDLMKVSTHFDTLIEYY